MRVLREDGLDFIGAESGEVHLADSLLHVEEGPMDERGAGCRGGCEDGRVVGRWGVLVVVWVMVVL